MRWKHVPLIFLSIVSLVLVSIILNPHTLQGIDRLLLISPCCTDDIERIGITPDIDIAHRFGSFSDELIWPILKVFLYLISSDQDTCCNICRRYQRFRCSVRIEELELVDNVVWWDGVIFKNVSVKSCDSPVQVTGDSVLPPIQMLPFHILQHKPIRMNLDYVHDVNKGLLAKDAIKINHISFNWNDFFHPVVNVDVKDVSLNIFFGKSEMSLGSLIELQVPIPSMTIGNWTVNEVAAMMPTPPEKEGLYPRLGEMNVQNVKIKAVFCGESGEGRQLGIQKPCEEEEEFSIPNELFIPLHRLTKEAGPGGVDQIKIQGLMKEAAVIAIRKHFLREDLIMEQMVKSQTLIQPIRYFLEEVLNESGKVLDHHVSILLDATEDLLQRWEHEWITALANQDDYVTNLRNEFKDGWDTLKNSALKVEINVEDAVRRLKKHISWNDMKRDVGQGWKIAKNHVKNAELNAGEMIEDFGKHVESLKKQIENDFAETRLGQEWMKLTTHLNLFDLKLKEGEKRIDNLWREIKKEAEADFDNAKLRVQEAKMAIINGWDSAKYRLSTHTQGKKALRSDSEL